MASLTHLITDETSKRNIHLVRHTLSSSRGGHPACIAGWHGTHAAASLAHLVADETSNRDVHLVRHALSCSRGGHTPGLRDAHPARPACCAAARPEAALVQELRHLHTHSLVWDCPPARKMCLQAVVLLCCRA